jgi:hypothetical protein
MRPVSEGPRLISDGTAARLLRLPIDAPLPFRGIPRRVKNSQHQYDSAFNREVDCIWETPRQGASDTRAQLRVF